MTRSLTTFLACLALAAPALAADGTRYGAGVSGTELVKVSELTAHPDRYVGKTVRVQGLVAEVCPRRGCWMEIAADEGPRTVRVKVDDGVIVFPLTAKGKVATAEGVFTRIEVPAERAVELKRHEAAEKGVPFDEKSVKAEPLIVYQIRGTGAVIR
jgi:hypothetical protein